MLNSIKSKTKKIICSIALALGIGATTFTGLTTGADITTQALNTNQIVKDVSSTVVGTGYNFNVSTSDSPIQPSGWTKLDSESYNGNNVIKGVVNIENDSNFDTEECGTSRPSMPIKDKDTTKNPAYYKNLMINANETPARFGYKKSSTITLEEDSYYRISVLVYTQKIAEKTEEVTDEETQETTTVTTPGKDPTASIYLTGIVDEDDEQYSKTKFENITTLGSWTEYFFYIDTEEKLSIGMELWLGSKTTNATGAVFFNEVTVLRYSEDTYADQINIAKNINNGTINLIQLQEKDNEVVENGNFEQALNGWKRMSQSTSSASAQISKVVDANTFSKVNNDLTITAPGTNCSIDNNSALFMYNKEDGHQAMESSTFTIDKLSYYRLTFWAKSDCSKGTGATVKLVDKTEDSDKSASLTLSTSISSNANEFRNKWTQYSFYIYGPSKSDIDATIQIWLGTPDSQTSGYVFVDDFRIEAIDYETYSKNSSSSNATTFNLNNGSDNYTIVNSDFDKTQNTTADKFYPATPADWTREGKNNTTTFSGIISTSEEDFDSIQFPTAVISPLRPQAIPYTDNEDNNVLMIGSTAETNSQKFSSKSFSLNADSYYSVSFYVATDYLKSSVNHNHGARVSITTTNNTLFDLYNIHYDNSRWHKIEVKIKTGSQDYTPSVNLIFDNTIGYVFFDKVELNTINEASFNDRTFESGDTTYYRVDLSHENFDNKSFNKVLNTNKGLDVPNDWKLNTEEQIRAGIVTADNEIIDYAAPSLSGNTSYLLISSLHDDYFAYTSNRKYKFTSSTYYKITINVLTEGIAKQDEVPEDQKDVIPGACISLADSSEILISGINTDGAWVQYTIYASFTEDLESAIKLSLGNGDETVSGAVLFDNLVITTFDNEESYVKDVVKSDPATIAQFINYTEPKDTEDGEEEASEWDSEINWLIIPSIITAVAIIIAVLGFYLRKFNYTRKPKIKTNYDRRKTLDKDIDKREKIALRQQIITELRNELANIDKEIEDFNQLANTHLEEIKAQIKLEQEELEKQKLELEIRKKEATAAREKQLKEQADFASDKKAEKQYNDFLMKLDRQELAIQKKINNKEVKIANTSHVNKDKLSKYLERKEYINLQIAKIEAEIEEIARQEEEIWAEYRAAKADAKRRKAEYKAQIKSEKEKAKAEKERTKSANAKQKTTTKSPAPKKTDSDK
ncbi:MAG: hypothetical protein E7356_03720 [Clostridiales bacterium]|nr:hypothetical protein [Clostridiales bacterium]